MEPIGKKYFNPKKCIEYAKHNLEIWPGFLTSVNLIGSDIFANVDMSFKVIRRVTALQHFKDLGQDKEKAKDDMIGGSVMTNYNKKMYQINDICFDKKVTDTFKSNNK